MLAFAPDGQTLAVRCSEVPCIRLYDVHTFEEKKIAWHRPCWARCMAFSADGNFLALGADFYLEVRNLKTGLVRGRLMGAVGLLTAVAYSPDGKLLATGDRDGTVKLWDVPDGP